MYIMVIFKVASGCVVVGRVTTFIFKSYCQEASEAILILTTDFFIMIVVVASYGLSA